MPKTAEKKEGQAAETKKYFEKPLKDWEEQRRNSFKAIKEYRSKTNENGILPGDEQEGFDKASADYGEALKACQAIRNAEDVNSRIDAIEQQELEETRRRDHGTFGGELPEKEERRKRNENQELRQKAFSGWLKFHSELDPSREERRAMKACGYRPSSKLGVSFQRAKNIKELQNKIHTRGRAVDLSELRGVLSSSDPTTGGALVPATLTRKLEIYRALTFGLASVATPMRTPRGEDITHPNITDNHEGRQVGESAPVVHGKIPTTGTRTIKAFKFTSDPVLIPEEYFEDAPDELEDFIVEALIDRVNRVVERKGLYADGNDTIHGLIGDETNGTAQLGLTTVSQVGFTADEIKVLKNRCPLRYRNNPRSGYMLHDSIAGEVELLKDSQGKYLWQDNLQEGRPPRLNGSKVFFNTWMPDQAAANKTIMMYGDYTKVVHRMVNRGRFYKMAERYRENDQTGFVLFSREDMLLSYLSESPIVRMKTAA